MGKLHEVIAAEETRAIAYKAEVANATTKFKNDHLFNGLIQDIRATVVDEGGGLHVPEGTDRVEVEITVTEMLKSVVRSFGHYAKVIADKEGGNAIASSGIMIDGLQIAAGPLPVTFLLSIENKLKPLLVVLRDIPVHDMKSVWQPVDGTDVVQGRTENKFITKKVERAETVIEATEHQPGQFRTYTEDMIVGEKTLTALSGKWSPAQKARIIERVENLISAFKQARQRANEAVVPETDVAFITDYLLDGV